MELMYDGEIVSESNDTLADAVKTYQINTAKYVILPATRASRWITKNKLTRQELATDETT
jgi:hypothetical protein